MNRSLFEKLMEIRNTIIFFDDDTKTYKYKLAKFDDSYMAKDSISGTPFRYFEAVPRKKPSKRKQNNTMAFDPYNDTLFDYPLVVKKVLHSDLDALDELNYQLTVQVPCCGMDCWHCYNDKKVCEAGLYKTIFYETTIPTKPWSAEEILEKFVDCRRSRQLPGHKYNILRVSGGEPFLIPELICELLELMGDETARDYADYPKALWTETNLVTWATGERGNSIVTKACEEAMDKKGLDLRGIFNKHKDKLIIHPCFHGLTEENIQQCTGTSGLSFSDLITGFRCLHNFADGEPFHLYPTFIAEACTPNAVEDLFRQLWEIDKRYPLKVAIISFDFYGPIGARVREHQTLNLYGRNASLKRWRRLLKKYYGIEYAQTLRPLAKVVASQFEEVQLSERDTFPTYEPLLILVKSTFRKEYRQELLSILAAPPNTKLVSSYDIKHIEPSTLNCLKAGSKAIGGENLKALIVYGNPDAGDENVSYFPIRKAIVRAIKVTEQLVNIEMTLENYVVLKKGSPEEIKGQLLRFKDRMLDYFGSSTLLKRPQIRWVLLGEEALLKDWNSDNEQHFEAIGKINGDAFDILDLRDGWDRLLDIIKSQPDLQRLSRRGVFLQLLPDYKTTSKESKDNVILLKEGNVAKYILRYFIPDFSDYDKDDSLKPSRTIKLSSAEAKLAVQGYQSKPLPKYGELDFQVSCNELDNNIPAQLIIESENQSCDCPRLQLEFLLKKVGASDR